ncbi:hypothetical protein BV25DRAFT_1906853 [Artomyces pyxidatus]|uniref:Uncharacterized protein n=1 Tax=Artomyces pyxidatus TaxID=48021 RepID=A0ACB8T5U2_9AGAM|nr:hypothetical protein BV25DRAFT_1906853 [Artomyces pyxidatus]
MTVLSYPEIENTQHWEKPGIWTPEERGHTNPVISSAEFALKETDLVQIDDEGVRGAAQYIHARLLKESYTPHTWRSHPMHLAPPMPYAPEDPNTRASLDWLFLISALNFSFWSPREGTPERYGVEWRAGWASEERSVWTGYWSLVAAVNRALEEGILITDPSFYKSEARCPDSVFEHIFRAAPQSLEGIPLLRERIAILREVGSILCAGFGGSFQGFLDEFQRRHSGEGTALQLVQMVTDAFPSFRDETWLEGRRVVFWKRAQILTAETWAAFYPPPTTPPTPHPLFPHGITQLTMFADYRVPQILHHLRILAYPPALTKLLKTRAPVAHGSREEVSFRAASIVAVERVCEAIRVEGGGVVEGISSVLVDFYLWDLAKRVEEGEKIEGIQTEETLPAHRTRSIWY